MIPKNKRVKYFVAALFGLSLAMSVSFLLSIFWGDITKWIAETALYIRDGTKFMEKIPMVCYALVIMLLPIFMLPITPLLVLAAARAGEEGLLYVLCWCWTGVVANILVSYFVSRKFGDCVRVKLCERGIKVPEIPSEDQCAITFLLRMIPGNPLSVQNYLLGLARIPFFKYAVVSIPVQMVQTFGYVYFGDGVFGGKARHIVGALAFFAVLAVLARLLKRIYDRWEERRNGFSKEQ